MIGTGWGRSHVVAWRPVFVTRDTIEVLVYDLLAAGKSVSATHAGASIRLRTDTGSKTAL
jgi:hypothetical protein